jgi:hypothetical protein
MHIQKSFFLGLVFMATCAGAQAPARLKLMTYNILNYRNFTSYCTSSNNNPITVIWAPLSSNMPDYFTRLALASQSIFLAAMRLMRSRLCANLDHTHHIAAPKSHDRQTDRR